MIGQSSFPIRARSIILNSAAIFATRKADRVASANKAVLEQKINRITLMERAKVSDDTRLYIKAT